MKRPVTAVVMNMCYTGLGIARSLGKRGVPVIGLTSRRFVYGNFTRYAKTLLAPDSRSAPEELMTYLLKLGKVAGTGSVIFPTRDDDVIFLNRFRRELSPYFALVVPESTAVKICLDKWETYLSARQVGIATPQCWLIESDETLRQILPEVIYPCVLKPVVARDWRVADHWETVGRRKAVGVSCQAELLAEYAAIARADPRALLQEMIPGGDDNIVIAACYLDRQSNWVAGFNTQKLMQIPEGFGTGCIVQAAQRPELFDPTLRLLREINFTGIAEVEFKWHPGKSEYQLIEVNPRPWDQLRLGEGFGTDLAFLAYCELAGLEQTPVSQQPSFEKWVAEDVFVVELLRRLWRRDPRLRSLIRMARGKRIYAIWSAADPLPSVANWIISMVPQFVGATIQKIWEVTKTKFLSKSLALERPH